jgi:hypothetical protein
VTERPDEEQERLDRELQELLNEVRVAMPGVQVLFAFLLAVPFQQGFGRIDNFQRITYFVTLLLAAASSACLIAPSAYHRLVFRHGDKPRIIRTGSRLTIAGLVLLALAMNGAILLVADMLFKAPTVIVTLLGTVSLFGWLWFGFGLARRAHLERRV